MSEPRFPYHREAEWMWMVKVAEFILPFVIVCTVLYYAWRYRREKINRPGLSLFCGRYSLVPRGMSPIGCRYLLIASPTHSGSFTRLFSSLF